MVTATRFGRKQVRLCDDTSLGLSTSQVATMSLLMRMLFRAVVLLCFSRLWAFHILAFRSSFRNVICDLVCPRQCAFRVLVVSIVLAHKTLFSSHFPTASWRSTLFTTVPPQITLIETPPNTKLFLKYVTCEMGKCRIM